MSALDDLMDINANWYLRFDDGYWEFIGRVDIEQAKSELAQLRAENERLTKLAYLGEHCFDDLTYKARCDELRAELEELTILAEKVVMDDDDIPVGFRSVKRMREWLDKHKAGDACPPSTD